MSIDNKIKEVKKEIKELKSIKKDNESRRKRASHLIQKGALLEIAGIDQEDNNLLLGYFLWLNKISDEKKEKLIEQGKKFFAERKK